MLIKLYSNINIAKNNLKVILVLDTKFFLIQLLLFFWKKCFIHGFYLINKNKVCLFMLNSTFNLLVFNKLLTKHPTVLNFKKILGIYKLNPNMFIILTNKIGIFLFNKKLVYGGKLLY